MTLAHKFREWLASLLPPGYNRSEEKRTFYGTIIMGKTVCILADNIRRIADQLRILIFLNRKVAICLL